MDVGGLSHAERAGVGRQPMQRLVVMVRLGECGRQDGGVGG
jgi:hypothetical protein